MAVDGGVNMVQLREKDLSDEVLLDLATELQQVIQGRASLVINNRLNVALACNADGVHLGEQDLVASAVREIVGEDMIIGRSAHSLTGAIYAERHGADYVVIGSIFRTGSHPGVDPIGIEILTKLRFDLKIPYIGIGGISDSNATDVVDEGASGVAVMRSILKSDDPKKAAQRIRTAVEGM